MKIKSKKSFFCVLAVFFLITPFLVYSQQRPEIYLSLEDVSKLGLDNNLDIQIAKIEYYMDEQDILDSKSIFDTVLDLEATYEHDKSQKNSSALADDTRSRNYKASLKKKFSTGTTVTLDAAYDRASSNSSSLLQNPSREAEYGVNINQPLAKNFFGLVDRGNLKITKLNVESSQLVSLDNIENYLAQVQIAYWNLALAYEKYKIYSSMQDEASKLFFIYKNKLDKGLAEKPDFYAAQANLEIRRSQVFDALLDIETKKNNLLFMLNNKDLNVKINIKDNLDTYAQVVGLYDVLNEAVEKRRDYKVAKKDLDINKIDLKMKKNSLWPQIDLEASFTKNGIDSSFNDSWQRAYDQANTDFSVGFKVSFPLENREARAAYKKADLKKAKYLLGLKRVESLILMEVNTQVQKVNTLANQVWAQRRIVTMQEEKLKAEKDRFQYGRSSSDLLIRYEDDLLSAKLSLVNYFFMYRSALIELDVITNSLLDKYWEGSL